MGNDGSTQNALLIDLDGVIYEGDRVVDGALQALSWMERERIPHLYVTNTTSRSRDALLQKFENLGFGADIDEVMTPLVAASEFLQHKRYRKIAAFVPADAALELDDFEIVDAEAGDPVDAVVVGDLGDAWDYQQMNLAFRLLMRESRPELVALGMTRYWRGPEGLRLDVAPFVRALEHAAACEAVVVGKPAAAFFDAALARLHCDAARTLMIGDDINADVDAAQNCGIRGIQVRTGKFRAVDLDSGVEPFALLDSIADLPDWWANNIEDGG